MELYEFIRQSTENLNHGNRYVFLLQRWSRTDPFWCLFVCKTKKSFVHDKNYSITGHYSFAPDANIHDILTVLTDTGVDIKICNDYFKEK